MAQNIHPARRARNLTGAVSALALVGMVTGFQIAAAAEETQQNELDGQASVLVPTSVATPEVVIPAEVAPVAEAPAPVEEVVVVVEAPAPVVEAPAPAPAPPAPAPAPVTPPSGTTAGS